MSTLAFHMPQRLAYLKLTKEPQTPQKQPRMLYVKKCLMYLFRQIHSQQREIGFELNYWFSCSIRPFDNTTH